MSDNPSLSGLLDQAVAAAPSLAASDGATRDAFLLEFAANLESGRDEILAANEADMNDASELSAAMRDRLDLSGASYDAMVESVRAVAALEEPIGQVTGEQSQPNGITVGKMRVPLGVVCFIYESRPNVTADGASLCLKSGNVAVLRGGREALRSNLAIAGAAKAALAKVGLPSEALLLVPTADRSQLDLLLADERLDLVIPRGGQALVERVQKTSHAPVLAHQFGNCHLYVDKDADLARASKIVANSKCQRPGTCNALESLVVHRDVADRFLPELAKELAPSEVELRGCQRACDILGDACAKATEDDWDSEYLAMRMSIKVCDSLDEAIEWINAHGSHHTDGILSNDSRAQAKFLREVDSASVMVNTSTRFADGFEYGLGAETGISTGKFHARGPVGLEGLTSYKWVVRSDGAMRA